MEPPEAPDEAFARGNGSGGIGHMKVVQVYVPRGSGSMFLTCKV